MTLMVLFDSGTRRDADYAAVAVEEEREVFAQASGVTYLICQLVIGAGA